MQCGSGRYSKLRQAVVGIEMVDGVRRNQLVIDKNCRRHGAMIQNIEAESNQVFAISFWKERDGAKKPRIGLAQFRAAFRRSVVSHDGAGFAASRFLEGA